MRIYVAGPYSASDDAGRLANTEEAMKAGLVLLQAGHEPFIPHLTHYLDVYAERLHGERQSWEDYMRLDLAFLPHCEALLRLPGPSKGADIEVETADDLGIPVYFELETLLTELQ